MAVAVAVGSALLGTSVAAGPRLVDTEPVPESIELTCDTVDGDDGVVVRCDWTEPTVDDAAGVQLARRTGRLARTDRPRDRVVMRTDDLTTTSFTDDAVRPGRRYAYVVRVMGADGGTLERSAAAVVAIPKAETSRQRERVSLSCGVGVDASTVTCDWEVPTAADAATATLVRSIDRGDAVAVARFEAGGPTSFSEPVPDGASRLGYRVLLTDVDGVVVATSSKVSIRTVDAERPAADRSDRVRRAERVDDVDPTELDGERDRGARRSDRSPDDGRRRGRS
ncbi:MAG: hypothetical protein AAGD33_06400 [Actinomycetota bacterium]